MIGTKGRLKAVANRAGIRRTRVAAVRARWERAFLTALPRRGAPATARILCYHGVGTPEWGINDLSPAGFRRQLELAREWGYRFVPASRIASGDGEPSDIAITFDDGLTSVATGAAPILAELDIPWTLFVVSDWAGGRHRHGHGTFMGWRDIERLAEAGVEIGSHSVSHPNFGTLGPEDAVEELVESRRSIEAHIGIKTDAFAIPMGRSGDWTAVAQRAARAAGYVYVYAQSWDRRPAGTVPRTFIARSDSNRVFRATLEGAMDGWEESL